MNAVGNEHPEKPPLDPLTRREEQVLDLLAGGLTSNEIAERLTLAVSSVRWYIQQVYSKLGVNSKRQAITRASELGLIRLASSHLSSPPGASLVVAHDLPADFPLLAPESRPSHNLPLELTPFIGRQREIAQVLELLHAHRLVTLTGSGGVGKTRLSIQVAGRMLAETPDGVWYVELAPISDPDLVPQIVASTFGLREEPNRSVLDVLSYFLGSRDLLLVLDNCEHLLGACARLAEALLRKAPRLKILASSREALGIAGEYTSRVPSLSVPDPHQMPDLEMLKDCEAVRLFTERAQAVFPAFAVDERNVSAVARICQRLDGIPLALVLAAARLNLLTPEQLASRLDHAFRLLTGGSRTALPRQQTLRATIDWSYELLSPSERVLLRRLAVFAGEGALEAIEAVCIGDGLEAEQILDLLSGLVNKSMVITEGMQQGEARYRLLETVRQYAREKLYDSGEIERLRNQHLDYFAAFAEEANPHIHGAGRQVWERRLKRELDNIREALEWSLNDSTSALQGLRIATAITDRFWLTVGLFQEAVHWLYAGLRAAGDEIPKLMEAKVYYCLARVLENADQIDAAFQQCVALCREIGQPADRELCMVLAIHFDSDFELSLSQRAEAVQIARAMGLAGTWELGEALFYYSLALSSHPQGAYDDQALAAAEESLQVLRSGDRWDAVGYWAKGMIQTLRGKEEQARLSLEMAFKLFNEVDDYIGISHSLFFLAWHHRLAGQYALAQRTCKQLFECVDAVAHYLGYGLFVYSTGMLLVNTLNDQFSKANSLAGQDVVRIISAGSKTFDESRSFWDGYARCKPIDIQALELLRHRIGEEIFSRAWKDGQELSMEEAVALARAVEV